MIDEDSKLFSASGREVVAVLANARAPMAWLSDLPSVLLSYPEIILAVACFILVPVGRAWLHAAPLTNWPLLGMLPSLLLNMHRLHDWCAQVLAATGGTLVFRGPWLATLDMLITCDPANINHILTTNFSNFPKGSDYLQIFDVLGNGIFNSDSHSWRAQRRMAHTHMRFQGFRRFVARTTREIVEGKLIPLLQQVAAAEKTQVVDFQDLLQRFTFDSTCTLVFGVNPNCLSPDFPTVPFARAVDEAKEVIHFRHTVPVSWWKLLRWLKVGQERKLADAWKTIDEFIFHHISTRREELKKAKMTADDDVAAAAVDLLTSYMGHAGDDDKTTTKSDQFLRDTVLNLLVAGRDTISSALIWFFWLVYKNPGVESKIVEELRRLKASSSPSLGRAKPMVFEAEELSGMVFLHAALCEALRLYPSVPNVHKGVAEEDVLPSGHRVWPGMRILYSLYAMGRMEEIWGKDCLEFRPERWISDHGTLKFEHSHKFLVFNAGPRSCLGKDVSFAQMKAVAAAVIGNFRLEVVEGQTICPMFSIILYMKNGLMVKVKEREIKEL